MPWYISFYASWKSTNIASICIRDLITNTEECLSRVLKSIDIDPISEKVKGAINESKKADTRLNVGKIGRGNNLSIAYRSEVADLVGMYPGIDFSDFLRSCR